MSGATGTRLRIDSDAERGRGIYPAFHALWPLAEMGVVSDLTTFKSDAWDAAASRIQDGADRTRVALIDTSVAADHPNLRDAIDRSRARDFFAARLGLPAYPDSAPATLPDDLTCPKSFPKGIATYWEALVQNVRQPSKRDHGSTVEPATAPSFSAHGTAMAGLIGARPVAGNGIDVAATQVFDPTTGKMTELPGKSDVAFAFAGVDPFCRIVPISTHFDPEPEQLIMAMLYATMIEADVIVLARDFPSPQSLAPDVRETAEDLGRALGVDLTDDELTAWKLLRDLTVAVSHQVPVICAAGNGAQDTLLSPADLAAQDNGIVAVGARAAGGRAASYSPMTDAITVYAPSGDGERLDTEMQRLDVQSSGFNPHEHGHDYRDGMGNFGDPDSDPASTRLHAPQDLVSTDVPGRAGYNSSPNAQIFGRDGAILDYRSAYCRFSGTSGAVALTAGLVSLAMSAGRIAPRHQDTGHTVKTALTGGVPSSYARAEPAIHWRTMPQMAAP